MNEHALVTGILETKNSSPIELDPARTALIVVDMQRYFTQPSHPFTDVMEKLAPGSAAGYLKRVRETVIPNLTKLLACFRDAGSPVVFTAVGSETGTGSDLPCWLRSFDELGLSVLDKRIWPPVDDPSWEIDEELAPRQGELVLNKLSAGAFVTTGLEQRLRHLGVDSVVVTGVATDVCVSTTTREAADRGFRTVVVRDACTTVSEPLHEANLQSLLVFGWLRTADDVIGLINDARSAA